MKKTNKLIIFVFIFALLLIAACSGNDNKNKDSANDADNSEKTTDVKVTGGEKLISVRAEYSYCYSTGNYDPTLAFDCDSDITYKQCLEWKAKQEGEAHTFFYATFSGGEPTKVGRTANEYYMKVKYGDGKELETDTRVIFKDYPADLSTNDMTDCYPTGTMEVYDTNDKLMGKMSFDNTNN